MRWRLLLTFTTVAVVSASCPAKRPDEARCIHACKVATRCGALPSTLGGAQGQERDDLEESCVDRCVDSDANSEVLAILGCLDEHDEAEQCPVDTCVEAIQCLRSAAPDAVVGTPQVTFRLIDGEHWTLLFQPEFCADAEPDLTWVDSDDIAEYCSGRDDPCRTGEGTTAQERLPLCGAAECDDDTDDPPRCDPRLCDAELSASYDCTSLGIDTVQFGYLDGRDVLHLAPTVSTCAEASNGVVFDGIAPGQVIYPLALFKGKMTGTILLDLAPDDSMTWEPPDAALDRPYCWYSVPNPPDTIGWLIRAGETVLAVPSPSSAILQADLTGNRALFPRGCGCPLEGGACEGGDPLACKNGRDDDQDGLIDGEDPGCE